MANAFSIAFWKARERVIGTWYPQMQLSFARTNVSSLTRGIGFIVRRRRLRLHLSAAELSLLAGVSLDLIQSLEWNMCTDVPLAELQELAQSLNLRNAEDILTRAVNATLAEEQQNVLVLRLSAQIQAALESPEPARSTRYLTSWPVCAELRTPEDYAEARRWYAEKQQEFEWNRRKRALQNARFDLRRKLLGGQRTAFLQELDADASQT